MDSAVTFRLLRIDDSTIVKLPDEWQEYLIELDTMVEDWENVLVTLSGNSVRTRIEVTPSGKRIRFNWPRSNPGHYDLAISYRENVEHTTITILPSKISNEDYQQLLEELEYRLPVSIVTSMQGCGAFGGIRLMPAGSRTLARELLRLRNAVLGSDRTAGLVSILDRLKRNPNRRLVKHTQMVNRKNARRVHPTRLPKALTTANNLDQSGRPLRVEDILVFESHNTYENALIAFYASSVQARLSRLEVEFNDQDATTAEVKQLKEKLQRSLQASWFLKDVVPGMQVDGTSTMVLINSPEYRAAYESFLEFQKYMQVEISTPALEAPLNQFPLLYELWNGLVVTDCLLSVARKLGYRLVSERCVRKTRDGLVIDLVKGSAPLLVLENKKFDKIVKLYLQRNYGKVGAIRSISNNQIPDISLEVLGENGTTEMFLFDPKYKLAYTDAMGLSKPKKEDIDKMHVYSDAIRDVSNNRVVKYAGIMYPGQGILFTENLEALPSRPSSLVVLQARLEELLGAALAKSE